MVVCKEYEARISALIDNELNAQERIEVLEHIAQCPACKAYWEDLISIRDALRAQEWGVPAGFANAVMARVRETKQEKTHENTILRFPQWRRFAALAACCAVVLLGIWSLDRMPGTVSMDRAMVNNSAAPECAAQGDTITGSVWDIGTDNPSQEMPDVDYGVSDDGTAAIYEAPEAPDVLPENSVEDDIKTSAENGNFTAAVLTGSDVAGQWVKDTLNKDWVSGAVYTLTEEQYLKLRDLLNCEGEEFTEIKGENTDSGYLLLAE